MMSPRPAQADYLADVSGRRHTVVDHKGLQGLADRYGHEPRGLQTVCGLVASRAMPYSNAGDKPWQMAALSGTQRIRAAISERVPRSVNSKAEPF